ncbi:MAG: hypothetical protein PUP91_15945 [Rhizonema sp. PD37]|nr:hypothetical protein [Rhizonema sp. PD37]
MIHARAIAQQAMIASRVNEPRLFCVTRSSQRRNEYIYYEKLGFGEALEKFRQECSVVEADINQSRDFSKYSR